MVYKNLSAELGKRALTMFEECKDQLPPKQGQILGGFDLQKPVKANVQTVLETMKRYKETEGGALLLRRSLNALLLSILRKEAELVGLPITQRTLKEAEQTLGYVRQYQQDFTEKTTILEEIEHLMARVGEKIERKEHGRRVG